MTNDTSASGIHLAPGTMLQSYRIENILGSGGFGVTYLATDTTLERHVVIKENFPRMFSARDTTSGTIYPLSGDKGAHFRKTLDRFLEEARMLASIHHPNIVEILNVFEANDTAYFVMPYIGSNNLEQYGVKERGKRIPEKQCNILLKGILDALAYLHSKNIYHRDIKPANILISDKGIPVLIDFGCARNMDTAQTVTVMSSEGFSAPEQMLGLTKNLGPWTDLYSLGASLYYLLTGIIPQRGDTRQFNDTLVPLCSIADLKQDYSPEFLATIDKAMKPDWTSRCQTASEWLDDLEHPGRNQQSGIAKKQAISANKPVTSQHPAIQPRSASLLQKPGHKKKGSGAKTVVTLLLLTALAGGGWYAYDNAMLPFLTEAPQKKTTLQQATPKLPNTVPPASPQIAKNDPAPATVKSETPAPLSSPVITDKPEPVTPVSGESTVSAQKTAPATTPAKSIPEVPAFDIRKSRLPAAFLSKIGTGDYEGLQKDILNGIKAMSSKEGDQIADPRYSHLLSVAELIKTTTPGVLTQFHRSSPKVQAFMKEFLNDPEWLELYLGAGLIPEKTSKGLEILADIWEQDEKSPDFRNFLSLATGISNVWSVGPYAEDLQRNVDTCNPVTRYQFFKRYQKQGRLHPDFMKLRPWEIRFVAGHRWDDASYEWAMQHVNLPWRRYTDSCWFAEYVGTSAFGDSIQGALFYVPWRDMYGQAESTKRHGGVCGGLSTFGSLCAAAHGMPTYTVGQPGHCAYAVRAKRNAWEGGFGGPDGGMHNYIFGSQAPTSFMLMEKVFGDDQTIDHAYRNARQASALEQLGDKEKALEAINKAVDYSPIQPFFRQTQQKQLLEKGDMTPQAWFEYASEALTHYDGNGYAALEALRPAEEQFIRGIPEQERLEWYKNVHNILAGTRTSWAVKIDSILDTQLGNIDSDKGREQFLESVFSIHLNSKDTTNFGQVLEWAVKTFTNGGQDALFDKAFTAAAASSLNSSSAEGKDVNKLKEAYGKAIFGAEQAHSIPAFHALTKAALMLENPKPEERTFKSEPLPGKLVPPSGMVRTSTTSGWDRPWEHLDMLKPCGGFNHTDKEAQPHVIVELPATVNLSGVIISKADSGQERIKKAKVSTSVDGATWFPLGETDNMESEWRLESPSEGRQAKWVKFEAINDQEPNFLHLKHFLVFSK